MKNLTVSMDEKVARWARVQAAREGISVSRLLARQLETLMRRDRSFQAAKTRFMTRKPVRLSADGRKYPARNELHER